MGKGSTFFDAVHLCGGSHHASCYLCAHSLSNSEKPSSGASADSIPRTEVPRELGSWVFRILDQHFHPFTSCSSALGFHITSSTSDGLSSWKHLLMALCPHPLNSKQLGEYKHPHDKVRPRANTAHGKEVGEEGPFPLSLQCGQDQVPPGWTHLGEIGAG